MTLSPDLGIARCCARKPNNAVDGQLAGLIIKGFQRRQVGFRRCGDAARGAKVPAEFFGWEEEAETCRFSGSLRVDRFASYMFLAVALRLAFCWAHVRRDGPGPTAGSRPWGNYISLMSCGSKRVGICHHAADSSPSLRGEGRGRKKVETRRPKPEARSGSGFGLRTSPLPPAQRSGDGNKTLADRNADPSPMEERGKPRLGRKMAAYEKFR